MLSCAAQCTWSRRLLGAHCHAHAAWMCTQVAPCQDVHHPVHCTSGCMVQIICGLHTACPEAANPDKGFLVPCCSLLAYKVCLHAPCSQCQGAGCVIHHVRA